MKLILAQPFQRLWAGRDAFEAAEQLQGEVFRELEGRRTLRTEVEGAGYFVKIHRGIGWGEIFKNLFSAKLPVLGAGQEWRAIQRLHEVGVPTMTAVAYGERGSNPAQRASLIHSTFNVSKSAFTAPCRGMVTIKCGLMICACWLPAMEARRRRILFRTTAFPTRFVTVKPNLGSVSSLSGRVARIRSRPLHEAPCWRTAAKSPVRRRR